MLVLCFDESFQSGDGFTGERFSLAGEDGVVLNRAGFQVVTGGGHDFLPQGRIGQAIAVKRNDAACLAESDRILHRQGICIAVTPSPHPGCSQSAVFASTRDGGSTQGRNTTRSLDSVLIKNMNTVLTLAFGRI